MNWLEPVECSFGQLRAVVAAAERASFRPVRMAVICGGYRVEFQRDTPAAQKSAVLNQSPNQNAVAGQPAHRPRD